jgi:hypothetical protein
MSDTWTAWRKHWDSYAQAFAQPLQANGLLSRFVTNPNVTGAYAEAWVRAMTRNMLGHRFRISTGAVIRATDKIRGSANVPQCDLIVWDPSEMPAIFESGEFALVPLFAARAIIEIKRTCNREQVTQQLKERRKLLPDFGPLLGVVITHPQSLFDQECEPNWLAERETGEPPITRLLDANNMPDTNGIMVFIYFLAQVAGHSGLTSSASSTRAR